jgi:predicted porin
MKKSLIALAAMAAAGVASAQSSVTLFGIVDAAISHYSVGSGGSSVTALSNSGYNSSRLGFRGTEDLGGGMSASFWLEGALANDAGWGGGQNATSPVSGAPTNMGFDFRRRSTVSLAGGWGELRLGRDYTPTFWNMTVFDAFGTNGIGSNIGHKFKLQTGTGVSAAATPPGISDPNYVRADNTVGYFLPPNLGGFYGQIQYGFDERTTSDQTQYVGARFGFASGPFNVAAAYGRTDGAAPTTAAAPDVRNWNIGGQWDFGVAKLLAVYDAAEYDSGAAASSGDLTTWVIGGLIPVGAGEIRLSYGRAEYDINGGGNPRTSQWAVGYVHNLSKRTAIYATYARLSNDGGASLPINASLAYSSSANALSGVANANSYGIDLGIRHSF